MASASRLQDLHLPRCSREHCTYQIIRSDVALGSKPFARDLDSNIEIKGARLTLGAFSGAAFGHGFGLAVLS